MAEASKARLLMERFDGLKLRDRLGLGGAVAVVIFFLVTVSLIAPDTIRRKQATAKVSAQQADLGTTMMKFDELQKQVADDPVTKLQGAREALLKQIADVDAALAEVDKSAPKMGSLVREMFATSPGVTVLSVKTLPVITVIQPSVAVKPPQHAAAAKPGGSATRASLPPAEAPPAVFRHGIEVSLKGNYLAMLPHLERLQRSSSRLAWAEAKFEVLNYPDARLVLVLYTLSGQQSPSLG
jgi:MSHA biogenesis protein MshJ